MRAFRMFRRHLDDEETLVIVVHKHWLLGCKILFWPSILVGLCIGMLAMQPAQPLFLLIAAVMIVLLVWWLRRFFDYFLDAWIITDTGIIDIAWHGWFHRESTRVLYSDLQGVSYEIHGVWGTLLRSGTISVEKISTGSKFSLECVRNPRRVEALILRKMEEYLHSKNLKNAKHVQEILAQIVVDRVQLNDISSPDDE
jgi:hypothetical protein